MKFKPVLQRATFIKRYKRFLADVRLADGQIQTIHCPNTGSMKNCLVENSPCWISPSDNPNRKTAYTWEIATVPGRKKAGINTALANHLVVEAIKNSQIKELKAYKELKTEVPYGEEKSRIDILLRDNHLYPKQDCFVEVKNVTLAESDGQGFFPDAVSSRGTKHLRELIAVKKLGHRAVLFFCVQHTGINWVEPADHIDSLYGKTLREALANGVEVLAYKTAISAKEIVITEAIPVKT